MWQGEIESGRSVMKLATVWGGGSDKKDGAKRADAGHPRRASPGLLALRWRKSPNASMCPTQATRKMAVSLWRKGTQEEK